MFKEFSDSIRLAMIERTSSPFLGFFVAAWLSFNWRAILILSWGKGDISTRIELVDSKYLSVWDTLWGPFIVTGAAILLYPMATYPLFKIWQWFNRQKESIIEQYDNQKRIAPEVYQQLKRERREQTEGFHELIATHESRERTLSSALDNATEKLQEETKKFNEKIESLTVENEGLKSAQVTNAQDISTLQEELSKAQAELGEVDTQKSALEQIGTENKALEKQLNKTLSKLNELRSKEELASDRLKTTLITLDKLERKNQPLMVELNKLKSNKESSTEQLRKFISHQLKLGHIVFDQETLDMLREYGLHDLAKQKEKPSNFIYEV